MVCFPGNTNIPLYYLISLIVLDLSNNTNSKHLRVYPPAELYQPFDDDELHQIDSKIKLRHNKRGHHFWENRFSFLQDPDEEAKKHSFISDNFRSLLDDGVNRLFPSEKPWPVKKEAVLEGDLILGGLMMVHEREDTVTCGPVMPQGGIQALETMMYTLDIINKDKHTPFSLGAHILDDCDKDTYGLEMAVDFIKGKVDHRCFNVPTIKIALKVSPVDGCCISFGFDT